MKVPQRDFSGLVCTLEFGSALGILEGRSDLYKQLKRLFTLFRNGICNRELPILNGALGSFSMTDDNWQAINAKIETYIKTDPNTNLVRANDLKDGGNSIHFDLEEQREMGKRFAERISKIGE